MLEKSEDIHWRIGFMAWRIGDILEFDKQIEWIHNAGFDGVSFHASPGIPNKWRGVDPAVTGNDERLRLKRKLSVFGMCEIHAPFALTLKTDELTPIAEKLTDHIRFAGDVGASVLTVHADIPAYSPKVFNEWEKHLSELNDLAGKAGVVVGLEITKGFEFIKEFGGDNIGVTLDVGHLYLNNGEGYRPYGTMGGIVRILREKLFHLHLHDYDGVNDHIEIGTGLLGFDELFHSLVEIGYDGAMCLELNPDLVSPEGIIRSLEYLRTMWRKELCL